MTTNPTHSKNEQRIIADALREYAMGMRSFLSDAEDGDEVDGVKADLAECEKMLQAYEARPDQLTMPLTDEQLRRLKTSFGNSLEITKWDPLNGGILLTYVEHTQGLRGEAVAYHRVAFFAKGKNSPDWSMIAADGER